MSYQSIDELQKALAEGVFAHTRAGKKASGRALGTIVELITFYVLCEWGLLDRLAIEQRVPEFAHSEITHNVEFSLHPMVKCTPLTLENIKLPLTCKKICDKVKLDPPKTNHQILSSRQVLQNCRVISKSEQNFTCANLVSISDSSVQLRLSKLMTDPYAIFECKRVGVEEGCKKGPQTIEKAKQGAYVARTVSSLQRARKSTGEQIGIIEDNTGGMHSGEYDCMRNTVIFGSSSKFLRNFILTVGIVSNHGNWFTSDSPQKEIKVLANSYDWLLFLTDQGLAKFVTDFTQGDAPEMESVREAFLKSYAPDKKENAFTKIKIDYNAHMALKGYFSDHKNEIESWFNVIGPKGKTLKDLQKELLELSNKDWKEIRA